jgi:hypothetical protein
MDALWIVWSHDLLRESPIGALTGLLTCLACSVFPAAVGGPVAALRDESKLVLYVGGLSKPDIQILSASGAALGRVLWDGGRVVAVGWTAAEQLLVLDDRAQVGVQLSNKHWFLADVLHCCCRWMSAAAPAVSAASEPNPAITAALLSKKKSGTWLFLHRASRVRPAAGAHVWCAGGEAGNPVFNGPGGGGARGGGSAGVPRRLGGAHPQRTPLVGPPACRHAGGVFMFCGQLVAQGPA